MQIQPGAGKNMNIKIWSVKLKKWLVPISIYFYENAERIWRIEATEINQNPLKDGWYIFKDNEINDIAIVGDINLNLHLLPTKKDYN